MALLETRPDVDVAFLSHVGFERTATLNDIWSGRLIGQTIRLQFWRVPSAEIPRTTAERITWLDHQWERVDAWVATHAESPPADAGTQPPHEPARSIGASS